MKYGHKRHNSTTKIVSTDTILVVWQSTVYEPPEDGLNKGPKHVSANLNDWLTVHRSLTLIGFKLDAQNSYLFIYNTFIKILYMFRALLCLSSGGLRHIVINTNENAIISIFFFSYSTTASNKPRHLHF
jgi:hypothetical protein